MHDLSLTVVAVATPPGRGGLGCVRISGASAEEVADRLFRPSKDRAAGSAAVAPEFGRFVDRDGRALDHGYRVRFDPARAFTGETTVELWAHGSPAVLAELVRAALAAGAAAAGPGEFTYRALRHGRIDLARAEAIRDLIAARTRYQARLAFAQADGALSRALRPLRETLEEWIARGEAAIEFVDEIETHLPGGGLAPGIAQARERCAELLRGYDAGRVVRSGATLALVGRPNVGKSSLFNRLLERDRAIVTEVAGTTRDTLEEELDIGGVPVRLIDTAGLREGADPIEREGVRRARAAVEEADVVVLVLDGSRPLEPDEAEALGRFEREPGRALVAINKCDLAPPPAGRPDAGARVLELSARTGAGIDRLREELRERLVGGAALEDPLLTDARHADALRRAATALGVAATALERGLSEELVLEDLRQAIRALGEITGEFSTEALYDRIFTTFCIGK